MVFASVYGCPFVREGDVRREATMDDFGNLVQLAHAFPELDMTGGTICEPNDRRSTRATSTWSCAADAVRQALHGLGDLGPERRPTRSRWRRSCSADARRSRRRRASISLINVNSPLRYDDRMLDALFAYATPTSP